MAEPFKNFLNQDVIEQMAHHFSKHSASFDKKAFIKDAVEDLEGLELKARSIRISETMIKHLPDDFNEVGNILLSSLATVLNDDGSYEMSEKSGLSGWSIMPIDHFLALQGHEHFDLSMTLFKEVTKRFTTEFGIRYFLIKSPGKTMSVMKGWASDDNKHVRRLASEGCRPKLPWGMHLPMFIEDPAPVIELLEILKDDDEEYVRRSVANNLNDIAKDHPELVADIAEKWMKDASKDRKRLIRHACRTLIKEGHTKALKVLGFEPPELQQAELTIQTPEVLFGSALEFSLSLQSGVEHEQPMMIDFVIHHQKANGTTSPKVFKWKTATLLPNKTLSMSKKHAIKKITTRVYYPGVHTLEVMVNGISIGKVDFQLVMPE